MKKYFILLAVTFFSFSCSNNSSRNQITKQSEDVSSWTACDKQEVYTDFLPIIEKYGTLGEEFIKIYILNIEKQFTLNTYHNASQSEIMDVFFQSINETSNGWTEEEIKKAKTSCLKNFEEQGISQHLEELCDCFVEKTEKIIKIFW